MTETPGAALVDGRDGLGGVVAEFCMELAISKARRVGVAWVTARNSNHFGIAGHYSLMAGELGCWRGCDSSRLLQRGRGCSASASPTARPG